MGYCLPITKESLNKLSGDLRARFSDDKITLFRAQFDGKSQMTSGSLDNVIKAFEVYCRRFNQAAIQFDPENPYGIIVKLSCNCRERQACGAGCSRDKLRPKTMIFLELHNGEDRRVGRTGSPIEERLRAERNHARERVG